MVWKNLLAATAATLLAAEPANALKGSRDPLLPRKQYARAVDRSEATQNAARNLKRQYIPANATDIKTINTPTGAQIRYKEPGNEGVCETTPGVNSYSGYIDLAPDVHSFFWFFESRQDPANDPITLWLNGGPGSDSLIGLFQELGPCRITENLTSTINPWSWNNVSNVLFLSQPVGVGFSYQDQEIGSLNPYTGGFLNASQANVTGRYPTLEPEEGGSIDTTDLAAMAAWETIQGLLSGLPQLAADVGTEKVFNLWTESYGGHYGPAFYHYFYEQNEKIKNATMPGYRLRMDTLGIGNGIIDEAIQAEYYPEYAVNNTYGIKVYNDTVYDYARFATFMVGGCYSQIRTCRASASYVRGGLIDDDQTITEAAVRQLDVASICSEAQAMCRDNVESMYYNYGDRGTYDIRHPSNDPTPPSYFEDYLNTAFVQNALGVSLNYTTSNSDIYWAFQDTGDFIYSNFLEDLETILDLGVRVNLFYGDADYICNWFGGEAVANALNYTNTAEFAAAGYVPFTYNGIEYGETKEYGNFSFTRIYEAGHEVPYYQPQAALALFNRTINHVNIADGTMPVTGNLSTNGSPNATHTHTYYSLPPTSSAAYAEYSSSLISYYSSLDQATPMGTMTSSMA
ncbi:peptidase S10, serine carboxypeptidase [Hortaea werneckii]|nr:peptidase S10, serine carboxypeptidase [Hortaea werneckii]